MRKIVLLAVAVSLTVAFSSCSMLLRGGANMARSGIQNAATAENPNTLQQVTNNVASSTSSAFQQATSNSPGLQTATNFFGQVTGLRAQAPQGAQETICNGNPCFTGPCGQFELLSVVGDSLTQEVVITLLLTQTLQATPLRHTIQGVIAVDAEGNSYEMKEPTPESEWRNLPQNVPVRVAFRRIGPVPTHVDRFVYIQTAGWNGSFEGACSPTFRNVAITWQ